MKKFVVLSLLFMGITGIYAQETEITPDESARTDVAETSETAPAPAWVQPGFNFNWTMVGASINYLGLMTKAKISYAVPFIKNNGVLWKSTKIEFGLEEYLSPSFTRTSVFLYFEPIAIFNVSVTTGYEVSFPGLTGGLYTFTGSDGDFSDANRKLMREASATDDVPGALAGWRTKIDPTFQIEFGPIAAVYTFTLDFLNYNAPTYFYDAESVTIVQPQDTIYTHDAKLLYSIIPGKFRLGLSFTDQIVQSSGYTSMIGALIGVITPQWEKCAAKRITPFAAVLVGTHIVDRYMVGSIYFAGQCGISMKL